MKVDERWDEGWVNANTREIRLQRRGAGESVVSWRSYADSGVHTGTEGDVAGDDHWFRMTSLPHVPDTEEAAGLAAAARVALLGGKWESLPDESIEYQTPGISWRLIHGQINDDERPFVVLDGYGGVFCRKTGEDRAELGWAGFQALFLAGMAQIVDMLSLRTGVLWTTHFDVESIRVCRDDDRWFHPMGLLQFDAKRKSPYITVHEMMNFGAGIRRDLGHATLSPDMAQIQSLLSDHTLSLRHELLFAAKRIEVMRREHNSSLLQHEWLDRSRFMVLSMAMECALRDLAREAGGAAYDDRRPLAHLPGFIAKHRSDWDLNALPELVEAFDIIRELRNAVAHARRKCSFPENAHEYDVEKALARFSVYLSRAIWQIASFCDGCLEGWEWAAERARAPLPRHRPQG